MIKEEREEESVKGTPKQRLYLLFRLTLSSFLIAVLAGLISSSILKLYERFVPSGQIKVWEVQDKDFQHIVSTLRTSTNDLISLQKLVAGNPDAAKVVARLQTNIAEASVKLEAVGFVERKAKADFLLGPFVSPANAQDFSTKPPTDLPQNMFIYVLLGLVAFVLIVFSTMYVFSKDKAKTAFAEKIITTIIGFALGMLTGTNTGRTK